MWSWAPLEGATGLGLGGWTWQEQGPGCAWGRAKSKVPPCRDVACDLGCAGGCSPIPVGSVPHWCVGRAVGRVRAEAPVPDWAREGAWLCWSLVPVAVPLSAGRCLGTEGGPALGQAGCLPCGLPAQQLPAVVGEETSEGQGGALCLEGRADPKTCCWLQHFVSYHTDNMGMGATQRRHSRKLLLHFAPDVFQRKALGQVKRKRGEGGGTGVCRSHACDLGWAGGSGVLMSSCSQPWGQPHTCLAGQRGAPGSFGQPIWMLQLLPLPSLLLPGSCAAGTAAQGADCRWRDSAVWHHCLVPHRGELLAQAQNVPWQDPGAASLLNIDGHCLHGGLGAPALQIVFVAAGPARVPPCSQRSSRVGRGAQQAGERCTASPRPGPLLRRCVALSEVDPGEGKGKSVGTVGAGL